MTMNREVDPQSNYTVVHQVSLIFLTPQMLYIRMIACQGQNLGACRKIIIIEKYLIQGEYNGRINLDLRLSCTQGDFNIVSNNTVVPCVLGNLRAITALFSRSCFHFSKIVAELSYYVSVISGDAVLVKSTIAGCSNQYFL